MVRARFAEIMRADAGTVPLDETALLVSSVLQPGLDPAHWLSELDALAAGCPTATPAGVADHLFTTGHFVGNRSAYHDWRNSCLDRVIATRAGIPISLSVLMIEVARRLGVGVVGVGMPAHFIVRSQVDADEFFDPFDGGSPLDRAGVRALFEQVTGGQATWSERYLEPTPNREIVIRMLNNLKGIFGDRFDSVRYAMVMDLRSTVAELAELEGAEITSSSAIFN
jgi:regulator of sirC expression with transglutaminase-like and TPR domain